MIGAIPVIFNVPGSSSSNKIYIAQPVITILIFFLFSFFICRADLLFYLFILIPYLIGAIAGGMLAGLYRRKYQVTRPILFFILFLPFLSSLAEKQFYSRPVMYSVSNTILIHAAPQQIWGNIIRIKEIREDEISRGFLDYAGLPRPLYAELDQDTLGATHIGNFDDGLSFYEKVIVWEKNQRIVFDIKIIPPPAAKSIFEKQIMQNDHFRIIGASYDLTQIDPLTTQLRLTSSYELRSHINWYSALCGNILLKDFQARLLSVVKARCDK